ncbi:MAG TPA: IS1595 family transposase [Xanthobacteraceae bacterium]|nr:IS1595 family transposase [Xanthobacteraceae bacterium]
MLFVAGGGSRSRVFDRLSGDWRAIKRAPIALDRLPPPARVHPSDQGPLEGRAPLRLLHHSRFKRGTLVEREGRARSRHVADVTAKTLREAIVTQASRKSYLMTDEAAVYEKLGREFSGHGTVNHSADEYVRTGGFHHTNTVESFFALFKRAVYGQFHHVSEQHLFRYLGEADFKYNHRERLGIDDAARAEALLPGAKGKRLLY